MKISEYPRDKNLIGLKVAMGTIVSVTLGSGGMCNVWIKKKEETGNVVTPVCMAKADFLDMEIK